MTMRLRSLVIAPFLLALLVAMPVSASTETGTVTGSTTFESCWPGSDGSCSANAAAGPGGAFSASAELNSPDSPLSRSSRYATALARYTIGFDLAAPTREAEISVSLRLDEARASWSQDTPEVFGGARSGSSGARVLFQLLGHEAPNGCGCGWPSQGSGNLVVAEVSDPNDADHVSDGGYQVTMTARNPYGDNLLPAGHYEILLRGYALTDLVGAGDWGTLGASMSGQIQDVRVTTTSVPTNLELSVDGNGSNRVLTAVLTDDDSAALDGFSISFYGDGELLGTAMTDEGVATLPVEGRFRGGSHMFTAEFAGADTYEPATAETRS